MNISFEKVSMDNNKNKLTKSKRIELNIAAHFISLKAHQILMEKKCHCHLFMGLITLKTSIKIQSIHQLEAKNKEHHKTLIKVSPCKAISQKSLLM